MPTTLHSIDLNAQPVTEPKQHGDGVVFAIACAALLLLAIASIFALPMDLTGDSIDTGNVAWLIGP